RAMKSAEIRKFFLELLSMGSTLFLLCLQSPRKAQLSTVMLLTPAPAAHPRCGTPGEATGPGFRSLMRFCGRALAELSSLLTGVSLPSHRAPHRAARW